MTTSRKIILFVDRQRALIEAFAAELRRGSAFDHADIATNHSEVLQRVAAEQPTIIAFESSYTGRPLSREVATLSAIAPEARLVVLAARCDEHLVEQAVRLDLHGCLVKSESLAELLNCLEQALGPAPVYSAEVERQLTRDPSGKPLLKTPTRLSRLSQIQLQILHYLSLGMPVKEVARCMQISIKSADSHTYRIMRLLGVHNRLQLGAFAQQTGIVSYDALLDCA
ncbi:MAG: response regulator transcription factor [Planctomycetaceae bacterium]|nr:response regulator transcription factor [Planctomycetaceae bacterium]